MNSTLIDNIAIRAANGEIMTSGIGDMEFQGTPVVKDSFMPSRVKGVTLNTVLTKRSDVTTQVTDGTWQGLHFWNGSVVHHIGDDTGIPLGNRDINTPMSIPIAYFLGMPAENEFDSFADILSNNKTILSQTEWQHYIYMKINKLYCRFKNFTVYVERGTAGGVQFLDDLVFLFREIPILPVVADSIHYDYDTFNNNVVDDSYVYLPVQEPKALNLKDGLSWEWSPSRDAWFSIYNMITAPEINPTSRVVRYKNLMELCYPRSYPVEKNSTALVQIFNKTFISLPGDLYLPTNALDRRFQIKLATPIIGGDIVVHVNYEMEVGAQIELLHKYIGNDTLYPKYFSSIPVRNVLTTNVDKYDDEEKELVENFRAAKKRKLADDIGLHKMANMKIDC